MSTHNLKKKTIEEVLERIAELNDGPLKKFKPSPDNIAGQRAGYIQCLKDLGLLEGK